MFVCFQILLGNSDTFNVATNTLNPPLIASAIRILPYSNHSRTVCLRVGLIGCPFQGNLFKSELQRISSKILMLTKQPSPLRRDSSYWNQMSYVCQLGICGAKGAPLPMLCFAQLAFVLFVKCYFVVKSITWRTHRHPQLYK